MANLFTQFPGDYRIQRSPSLPRLETSDSAHQLPNSNSSLTGPTCSTPGAGEKSFFPKRTILDISPEIIDQILTSLKPEDQACFILTCSYYYSRYQASLKDKSLHEHRAIGDPYRAWESNSKVNKTPRVLYLNTNERPIVKLLRRLANDRWKYCGDCWRLHPQSQWADTSLGKPCMPYAGVLDLCPCVSLTYMDCRNLTESLQEVNKELRITWDWRTYFDDIFKYPYPMDGSYYYILHHKCDSGHWFKDHPFENVEVHITLDNDLQGSKPTLHASLRIYFDLPEGMTRLQGYKWLWDEFDSKRVQTTDGRDGVITIQRNDKQRDYIEFKSRISLGNGRWPDQSWMKPGWEEWLTG
ncbi:uncharacterized protein N7458_006277 [Penicillium daleae]|uniref:F-box domain-containing protein n=1 Tax=Penicillium daleae TaxID=63821 RepID=A0AAD6C6T0_9EURO|nr:uncharacterized protein N7458_006277 [Penicillium daleae]KAJ5449828.1 hypothetical protein N7458_006277 [Penicillium daleae]